MALKASIDLRVSLSIMRQLTALPSRRTMITSLLYSRMSVSSLDKVACSLNYMTQLHDSEKLNLSRFDNHFKTEQNLFT